MLAALVGLLAACSSSGTTGSTATSSSPAAAGGSTGNDTAPAAAASFVNIVEPFDPGHPARTEPAPASCGGQATTIAVEQCHQTKTENVDVQIDLAQSARYASASPADRGTILAQDSAWLAAREPVCAAAFNTGGTIDGISAAACLLDERQSWYTTPEGSRIAEISTQGDQTGGAVIAWVIVGGASGFVVNPKQFYFQDGSFTDPGIVQGPSPAFHRVATGTKYEFDIDYSKLSKDPSAGKSGAGYLYAPGTPVAVWAG